MGEEERQIVIDRAVEEEVETAAAWYDRISAIPFPACVPSMAATRTNEQRTATDRFDFSN